MTIHTRLHVEDPSEVVDGKCQLCAVAETASMTMYPDRVAQEFGRLLDLDELLEQARTEGRDEIRVKVGDFVESLRARARAVTPADWHYVPKSRSGIESVLYLVATELEEADL